jgi:ABC-type antimicrobial peptide transport system permease subunit
MKARDRGRRLDALLTELQMLPGVRSAAMTMRLPLRGSGDSFGASPEGHPEIKMAITYFRVVTPDYFATMGMKLRDGRLFDLSDRASAADSATEPDSTREIPVVVNQALAKTFFPGENPIGRRVSGGFDARQRIVGVVANVAEGSLTDAPLPTIYYPAARVSWFGSEATIVLRTARAEELPAVLDDARHTVQRVAPDMAVQGTTTMERVLDDAVGPARQVMSLLTLLSALALVLGAVGIYGVISHFAARRRRDWAIRVALGLPGSKVVGHIVGQGAMLVGLGILSGAVATAVLARLLASFLFGVSTVDPLAFLAASAALLAIGTAAAFIPAWRAGTVSPALVMREQ